MSVDIININVSNPERIVIDSTDIITGNVQIGVDNVLEVIEVSDPEHVIVDAVDIITGNIQIVADNALEVIRVVERGLQGIQGPIGLSGAGKPFNEIIAGMLYQSTASISVFSDFYVTGSTYITQNLITYGNIGINTNTPASSFELISVDGARDLITVASQSVDYFSVNNQGITVLGEFSFAPDPVMGGIYRDSVGFYVGI